MIQRADGRSAARGIARDDQHFYLAIRGRPTSCLAGTSGTVRRLPLMRVLAGIGLVTLAGVGNPAGASNEIGSLSALLGATENAIPPSAGTHAGW